MNTHRLTARDMLFEEPGPRAKRRIRVLTVLSLIALAALIAAVIRRFYETGQLQAKYWSFFTRATTWRFLGQGLLGTIEAALTSGVLAFCAGYLMMRGRISRHRVLNWIGTAFVEFTRGVPTLLFIYFFFLVVPQFGIPLSAFWKITIPVALSASGVVAEVLRSGVNAVPKGQKEAALALGLREGSVFRKVVFPQAIRYVIPALLAELVIVVKDTTFAYVVNFPDLMQNARVLISNYDALLAVYLTTAVIYILINFLLNRLSDTIAARQKRTAALQAAQKGA